MCIGRNVIMRCPCRDVNCSSRNPFTEEETGHLMEKAIYIEPCDARENKPQRPGTYPRCIRWSNWTRWDEEICDACRENGCSQ